MTYYAQGRIAGHDVQFVAPYREANPSPVALHATVTVPLSLEDITAALWIIAEDGMSVDELYDTEFARQAVLETLLNCGSSELADAQDTLARLRPGDADYQVANEFRTGTVAVFGPYSDPSTETTCYAQGRIAGHDVQFVAPYREANPCPVALHATITVPLSLEDIQAALWVQLKGGFTTDDLTNDADVHELILSTLMDQRCFDIDDARHHLATAELASVDGELAQWVRDRVAEVFGQPAEPEAPARNRRRKRGGAASANPVGHNTARQSRHELVGVS
jgi:hypothetical protein